MSTEQIRELLERAGYTFAFKEADEWVKCLISGNNEQWLGKGFDEAGALQDVTRQMFPSKVALDLLTAHFTKEELQVGDRHVPELPLVPLSPPSDGPPPWASETPEVEPDPPGAPEPEPVATVSPVAIPDDEPEPEPVQAPTPPPVYAGTKAYVDPDIAVQAKEEEEKISREEALEIVQAVADEIDDNVEDLAISSSLHQRLQVGDWIFQGRTIQEQFKRDLEIEEAVHRIARRLTDFCKVFWPGSVRALQVYTTPAQALDGLVRTHSTPLRWAESAAIIEAHMTEIEGRSDFDEFGWRDRAMLTPECPNPALVLGEVLKKIESVIGPLDGPLDDKRKAVPASKVLDEIEELVMAGHLLRWIRLTVVDRVGWGKAMGALRWASRQSRTGAEALREVIHDEFQPSTPWAQLLGRDPEINRKNRIRKQVMKEMPTPEWLEEDLMSWLHKAFQVFTNPQIAKLAIAVRADVLEFTNADFADADRNTRSRLRKLQAIFRNSMDLSRIDLPSEADLADVDEPQETPKSPKVEDPAKVLLAKVQVLTEGKHILFVTNRDDPQLQKALERDLKCKVTLKDGGNPRTMSSVIKSVDGNRYDFVLMATGFNNHSADAALCRAAKGEGLPYVRVQKGRPAATIRALGRAFNVTAQRKEDDEATVAQAG
jgi:hypothetical protein